MSVSKKIFAGTHTVDQDIITPIMDTEALKNFSKNADGYIEVGLCFIV